MKGWKELTREDVKKLANKYFPSKLNPKICKISRRDRV